MVPVLVGVLDAGKVTDVGVPPVFRSVYERDTGLVEGPGAEDGVAERGEVGAGVLVHHVFVGVTGVHERSVDEVVAESAVVVEDVVARLAVVAALLVPVEPAELLVVPGVDA